MKSAGCRRLVGRCRVLCGRSVRCRLLRGPTAASTALALLQQFVECFGLAVLCEWDPSNITPLAASGCFDDVGELLIISLSGMSWLCRCILWRFCRAGPSAYGCGALRRWRYGVCRNASDEFALCVLLPLLGSRRILPDVEHLIGLYGGLVVVVSRMWVGRRCDGYASGQLCGGDYTRVY